MAEAWEDIDPKVMMSRLADGVRGVLTDGAFDAFAVPAPNGTMLDPSGLVKGWSIERAAELLVAAGLDEADIVRLAELVSFMAYLLRLVAGLRALEEGR